MKLRTLILEIRQQTEFHLILRSIADGHESSVTLFSADTLEHAMVFAACTFQDLHWQEQPGSYYAKLENCYTRNQPSMTVPGAYTEQPKQTAEEWIKQMHVHPSIVRDHLTNRDGTLRIPRYSEWAEDFGLGYVNRLAWERTQGEY